MTRHRYVAVLLLVASTLSLSSLALAQAPKPPYLDPSLPVEARVKDLLGRMTLDEKVSQMQNSAPAIPRLGIPAYDWWNEGLHGVARSGYATVFPQAIGLGATWDAQLVGDVATAISDEARAKYHEAIRRDKHDRYYGLTFWSPNINIFRDPRWGRGQETYGEDPYLTGTLGVAFVKGLQGNDPRYLKVIATPKHYAVHSGPEPERHGFDASVSDRDLRETYLPAFRATVVEGGARSVMCAYNRTDGLPCCANPRLLNDILRGEWKFNGYVTSDCGAIGDVFSGHHVTPTLEEATAATLKAGTDLDCGDEYAALVAAVQHGRVAEADVDRAVGRLFEARFRLGMFDPDAMVPYAQIPFSANDSEQHRQLARRAALESMVLLKNEKSTLPLSKSVKTIAVIGPNANQVPVLLGNYNGTPSRATTPYEGIKQLAPPGTTVVYREGAGLTGQTLTKIPVDRLSSGAVRGLRAEYFGNATFTGEPALVRTDEGVDFDWGVGAPDPKLGADNFSVRWTGTIVAPVSGTYRVGLNADDGARIWIDGKLVAEDWTDHAPTDIVGAVALEAGKTYELRIDYFEHGGGASATLEWSLPPSDQPFEEAVDAAKAADVVVAVLGISPSLEGEEMSVSVPGFKGGDRTDVNLPAAQQKLLEALVATGKPVVLVLLNGSALGVTWANEHVPAILEAWYPGEEGGAAIAETLFGASNPGGRLPVTFYASVDQLPPFENYSMDGRTYRFFAGKPLYPFGHGLSYTTFAYSGLALRATKTTPAQPVTVAVDVKNTGARDGDEVVQLYATDVKASVRVPIRSLQGFQRIHLAAGETRRVTFTLEPRQLTLIDDRGKRVLEPGAFRVEVGGLTANFEVTGTLTEIPLTDEPAVGSTRLCASRTLTRMNYRRFGRTGWSVSEIGYGMWGMAGWTGSDDGTSASALQRAVDLGCTFFDTAYAYGDGKSEAFLGELVRNNPDTKLYTATKIPPKNQKWPARREFSLEECYPPDHIDEYARKSLANAGLEFFDLIQLHTWEDHWLDDDRFAVSVERLRSDGVARAVGISMNRWEAWNGVAAVRSGLVDAVQVIYNIFDQSPQDELLPACREHDVAVIARVPFDEGSLTGTLTHDSRWPEGDWRNSYFVPENLRLSVEHADALKPLVPEGSSMPDMALRFILAEPTISTIIPGMRRTRHVDANLASSDAEPLPEELVSALRRHRWDRTPTDWSQ